MKLFRFVSAAIWFWASPKNTSSQISLANIFFFFLKWVVHLSQDISQTWIPSLQNVSQTNVIQHRHWTSEISWHLRGKKESSFEYLPHVLWWCDDHSLVNVQVTLVHAASLETCWIVCLMSWQGGNMLNYPFKMSNRVLGSRTYKKQLTLTRKELHAVLSLFRKNQECTEQMTQGLWDQEVTSQCPRWELFTAWPWCWRTRISSSSMPLPLLSPPSCQWTVNQ